MSMAVNRASFFCTLIVFRNEKITSDIQRCERAEIIRPLDVLRELDLENIVLNIEIVVLIVRIVARV